MAVIEAGASLTATSCRVAVTTTSLSGLPGVESIEVCATQRPADAGNVQNTSRNAFEEPTAIRLPNDYTHSLASSARQAIREPAEGG
jgi:hypothetical protein